MPKQTPKTWHEHHYSHLTPGQRIADRTAAIVGSWKFIIIQSCIVFVWLMLNIFAFVEGWDPYPFILLNLLFSLQAAYTAPIIMMAQNRQNDRDRMQAQADYQTNLDAKQEIEALAIKLNQLEVDKLDKIIKMMEEMKMHAAK